MQKILYKHVRHKHKKLNTNKYKTKIIMKKRILLITLIGMSFSINAQDETVNGNLTVNGSISNKTTGIGQRMEKGSSAVTTLRFDSDRYRIYAGGDGGLGEVFSVKENGNVGIGTSSPGDILHVSKVAAATRLRVGNNGAYDTFVYFNGNSDWSVGMDNSNSNAFTIGNYSTLGTNTKFVIETGGNVGIGTTDPGIWKLAVNGNIRAKEIKVETGWSDFVFENDYSLPTLKEVEKHIKEKGHLKDIPSAKEVEKNGIFLGEMDSKLLQKIEELTLYTIQQQKEIVNLNKLKSKVQTLEKENESLKYLATKFLELQKRMEKLEKK